MTISSILGRITEETPKFSVVKEFQKYSIRKYEPQIRAITKYKSSSVGEGRTGFWPLANFIFGNNKSKESNQSETIKMTAPVYMQHQTDNDMVMSFVLPSKYSMQDLPTPNDQNVVLTQVGGYDVAVIQFSGTLTDKLVTQKEMELRGLCEADGVKLESDRSKVLIAGYNPPWTPSFWRTNEIQIQVVE